MMVEAIFLDFDDTLYSHKTKKIPDNAYQAVLAAQQNNVKIFISSGRGPEEMVLFDCRGIEFDGYILNNGQIILDKDLNPIYTEYIEGKGKDTIINEYNKKKYPIVLRGPQGHFINLINDDIVQCYKEIHTPLPIIKPYNNEDIVVATILINTDEEKKKWKKYIRT